jgi:hypothetical protein
MANFAHIRTREQMHDFIILSLGGGVNHVEIPPDGIDLCIDTALLDMWRYNAEEGSYLHYFHFLVNKGQSEYCLSGMGIQDAYDLQLSGMMDGLTTLFSPMNMFYNAWAQSTGNPIGSPFPIGSGGYASGGTGQGGQLMMAEYNGAMQYMKLIEKQFGKGYTLHWHPGREVLEVVPTPKEDMGGLVALYVREEEQFLFDNPLYRKLVVAKAGMLWGDILTKVTGAMPDGLTLNGELILTRYTERHDKAFEDLRAEGQTMDFFMG